MTNPELLIPLPKNIIFGPSSAVGQTIPLPNSDHFPYFLRHHAGSNESKLEAMFPGHKEGDNLLIAGLGFKGNRVGIDMCEVCKPDGSVDSDKLDLAKERIKAMKENGLEPVLTLWHFSNLKGFDWLNPKTVEVFNEYVRRVASELKDTVKYYIVLNEPNVYFGGLMWMDDGFVRPKGKESGIDPVSGIRIIRNLRRAYSQAYDDIHQIYSGKDVKVSASVQFVRARPYGGKLANRAVAGAYNFASYGFSMRLLRDRMDFIALNTYTSPDVFQPGLRERGKVELLRPIPSNWVFDPQAWGETLKAVAKMFPTKDIMITECGWHGEDREKKVLLSLAYLFKTLEKNPDIAKRLKGIFFWSAFPAPEWCDTNSLEFEIIGMEGKDKTRVLTKYANMLAHLFYDKGISRQMLNELFGDDPDFIRQVENILK